MDWLKKALSMNAVVNAPGYNGSACLDAFKSHWSQIKSILHAEHPTIDMQIVVFRHLEQLVSLLTTENWPGDGQQFRIGPMLEYCFNESVFSLSISWAVDSSGQSKLFALKSVFKLYEMIIGHTTPCIIVHKPILNPLLHALEECDAGDDEWLLNDLKEPMVFVLHQICTKIAQKEEWSLLEFFFQKEIDQSAPRLLVFTLLVPFLYYGGRIESLVRDAMLLVLSVSSGLDGAADYLADETNFCPVLASGLAAVYSSLPRQLGNASVYEDWCRIVEADLKQCPELLSFRNALEFCNAVAQASHQRVVTMLVKYLYNGLLLSVLKQALIESTAEDLHAAVAYLELMFRCLTEPPIRDSLIRFVVMVNSNGLSILEYLVHRMDKYSQLTNVCLALFDTILALNSEAVMFELIFRYLIPLRHVANVGELQSKTLFDDAFDAFVAASPLYGFEIVDDATRGGASDEVEIAVHSLRNGDDNYIEDDDGGVATEQQRPGRVDAFSGVFKYCRWARFRVECSRRACRRWRYAYDGQSPNVDRESGHPLLLSSDPCAKADLPLSTRRSECSTGINANCLFRQSRTKAYYAKKRLDNAQEDRLHAISALDLAITAVDADMEGFNNMLLNTDDKSRLISFESETFLNLYCSTAVPSSFMQLTFVESCPSGREESNGPTLEQATQSTRPTDSADGLVDFSKTTDLDTFERFLDALSPDQRVDDVTVLDVVSYINFMYDKLLLPHRWQECGDKSSVRPTMHKLRLDNDDETLCQVDEVNLDRVVTDDHSPPLGPFLSTLLAMLQSMLHNSFFQNLLLTGVLAKVACYPQVLISSLLLSSLPIFQHSLKVPIQIISSLAEDIKDRLMLFEHLSIRLQLAKEMIAARMDQQLRQDKSLPSSNGQGLLSLGRRDGNYSRLGKDERAFLAGYGYAEVVNPLLHNAIVLDEFCKELAAIAIEHSLSVRIDNASVPIPRTHSFYHHTH